MTYPGTKVYNTAGDSANVGAQAQVIHGGVHNSYYVPPGATAKEKYEVGIKYLNSRVPSMALSLIEQAIAEGLNDTSEVRFHWLLALLSGRTYRQLSSEDNDRLDFLRGHYAVRQSDPWADGIRAVLRLLDSLRSPGGDSAPFIDALEHLNPAQKEPVLQHITVFLRGPKGDQIWQRDIEAAEADRYANERDKRARYFFFPVPTEALCREPTPAEVPSWDHVKAVAASVVFVLALLTIGWELISHISIIGLLGYLVGCAGVCLAATNWMESRWQARREGDWRLIMSPEHATAPESGFPARVDQRFDWYLRLYAPDKENVFSWLSATAGIRTQLRHEIVEIYRGRRIKAEQLNWLIGYEVRQLVRRWKQGTFYTQPHDDKSRVRPVALWTGIPAAAAGGLLTAVAVMDANPLVGSIALLILGGAGCRGVSRWTSIALERRRATADRAESNRRFSERQVAYETWLHKLTAIQPTDQEIAGWLECDKKVIFKRALRHYGLKRSDVISYAFLETPSAQYERASVLNGPWRYTQYKIIVFLLTADGIRQVTYELSTRDGDIQQRDRQSYRYDAIASVEASVAKDGYRQEFKLHLVNGQDIPFRAVDPLLTEWDPDDGDVDALSRATEDATGLGNTLRILEGVAADGKEWITRETQ